MVEPAQVMATARKTGAYDQMVMGKDGTCWGRQSGQWRPIVSNATATGRPPYQNAEQHQGQEMNGTESAYSPEAGISQWRSVHTGTKADGTPKWEWQLNQKLTAQRGYKVPHNFVLNEVLRMYHEADDKWLSYYSGYIMGRRPLDGITLRWNGVNLYTTAGTKFRFNTSDSTVGAGKINAAIANFTKNWPSDIAFDGILHIPYRTGSDTGDDWEQWPRNCLDLSDPSIAYEDMRKKHSAEESRHNTLFRALQNDGSNLDGDERVKQAKNHSKAWEEARFTICDIWNVEADATYEKRLRMLQKNKVKNNYPNNLRIMANSVIGDVKQIQCAKTQLQWHESLVIIDPSYKRSDVSLEKLPVEFYDQPLDESNQKKYSGILIGFSSSGKDLSMRTFKVQSATEGVIEVRTAKNSKVNSKALLRPASYFAQGNGTGPVTIVNYVRRMSKRQRKPVYTLVSIEEMQAYAGPVV